MTAQFTRTLTSALRRYGEEAPAVERALALATLIELGTALEQTDNVREWTEQLHRIALTDAEKLLVESELSHATALRLWISASQDPAQQ